MKRAPRSHQHHDLYQKYHGHDSKISGLLGECGFTAELNLTEFLRDLQEWPLYQVPGGVEAYRDFVAAAQAALVKAEAILKKMEDAEPARSEMVKKLWDDTHAEGAAIDAHSRALREGPKLD